MPTKKAKSEEQDIELKRKPVPKVKKTSEVLAEDAVVVEEQTSKVLVPIIPKSILLLLKEKKAPPFIVEIVEQKVAPLVPLIKDWKDKVESIVITGIDDKEGMAIARESKLFVKRTRIEFEKSINLDIDDINQKIQPYLDEKAIIKDILDTVKAMFMTVQVAAEEKEKTAENQKKAVQDEIRNKRKNEVIELKINNHLPPLVDLAEMSEEDWEKTKKIALASKKVEDQLKEEELEKDKIAAKEKLILQRREHLYQNGFRKNEFGDMICYCGEEADEIIITNELLSSLDDKSFEVLASSSIKKAKELSHPSVEEAVERTKQATTQDASEKRKLIFKRVSFLPGVKLLEDGIELPYTKHLLSYDDLTNMTSDEFDKYADQYEAKIIEFRESKFKNPEKSELENEIEKLRSFADEINTLKEKISKSEFFDKKTKMVKNSMVELLKKTVKYVDDKIEEI